ncbi:MAG: TIGR00282 family metallophosphoesterase [Clostridia bacterium]|nr:TIGR00282 family metallophosphoesterase [Clostridia bacterium]
MKLLALGDIVGNSGCEFVRKMLPGIKKLYNIDICIANGENSATGNGILPYSADHLFASGVDFITTGNHVFRRSEIHDYLDSRNDIIRPYNMHKSVPGRGVGVIDMMSYKIGIINLIGTAYQNANYANPFDALDKAIAELKDCQVKIVDFHAESTGEKRALGIYADSRVSVLFGTHTHVQTADAQILTGGTGYITDLGMCGSADSVLGVESECVIKALKTGLPTRFKTADKNIKLDGCIFEINEKTGLCISAEPVSIK